LTERRNTAVLLMEDNMLSIYEIFNKVYHAISKKVSKSSF